MRPASGLSVVSGVVEALLDLVVPRFCAGCAAPQQLLCPVCEAGLRGPARRTAPSPTPPGFPPTWTAATYDGVARDTLLAHKERGRLGLAAPLGAALALSVSGVVAATGSASGWPSVVLVPVPSAPAATRARGHDPMLRIARRAAYVLRRSGCPTTVVPALAVGRTVSDQSGLGATERAENLSGAHRLRPRHAARLVGPVAVVLVDDLVTTGASLTEAARALRTADLPLTGAAVVAATARRVALDRGGPTG